MISRLHGVILEKQPPFLLLDVGGVGYEVQTSMNTFYRLPEIGANVVLYTHFVVREDAQLLFGFAEIRERSLFRTLIKVNGVGPKVALTILSSIEPDSFVHCVETNNSSALQRLPGIGKKTAERLILDMRDRLKDWDITIGTAGPLLAPENSARSSLNAAQQDAVSALIALGYKPPEASRAIAQINTPDLSSAELIRLALKSMHHD